MIPDYDAAISLAPDDPDLRVRRAMALNQIDRREEALKDAKPCSERSPVFPIS